MLDCSTYTSRFVVRIVIVGDSNRLAKGLSKTQVLGLVTKGPEKTFDIIVSGESGHKQRNRPHRVRGKQ